VSAGRPTDPNRTSALTSIGCWKSGVSKDERVIGKAQDCTRRAATRSASFTEASTLLAGSAAGRACLGGQEPVTQHGLIAVELFGLDDGPDSGRDGA